MALTFDEKIRLLIYKLNSDNEFCDISLKLDIEPLPYARPRKGKNNQFYNPRAKYKKELIKLINNELSSSNLKLPCRGIVELDIEVYLPAPKDIISSKVKSRLAIEKVIAPQVRPDIDNYIKPILDALNGILYKDDGQIVKLESKKLYAIDTSPCIIIKTRFRNDKIKLR